MIVHPLRETGQAGAPLPKAIAIGSGKGGVGKTWFSASLAHAFGRLGQRALLVDADLGLANADVQLGLNPKRDLAGALLQGEPFQEAITQANGGAGQRGFDVLAGRSGNAVLSGARAQTLSRLIEGLAGLSAHYDRLVLDLGAGADPTVLTLAMQAGLVLVVVTDEPTSLTDAYAFIKRLMQSGQAACPGLIVNMAAGQDAGQRTQATLRKAAAEFLNLDLTGYGIVPKDPAVKEAIRRQMPFLARSPNSPAALAVQAIAQGLTGTDARRSAAFHAIAATQR